MGTMRFNAIIATTTAAIAPAPAAATMGAPQAAVAASRG